MASQVDKRIRHSKERLTDAMVEYLQTMPLESVTVKKLCDMADVNRSTFYAHYMSPLDLYKEIEQSMTSFIVKNIDEINARRTTYEDLINRVVDYYDKESDKMMVLLKTNSASFKNECMKYLEKTRAVIIKDPNLKLYYQDFFVSGIFAIISRWIEGGKVESKKVISELLLNLLGKD